MSQYYNSFGEYLKMIFGCKVHKISINAGFTCPNRDGTYSYDGCIFCDDTGSAAEPCKPQTPISEQIAHGKEVMSKKYKAKKFLAYFQAYTNTYAPVEKLERLYRDPLMDDDFVGLIIGTRPDCVSDEILDMIAEIAKEKYVQIEYGLQSIHDKSLEYLNRHHTFADFISAFEMTRKRAGIKIGAHVILGIKGESASDMIDTARTLSDMGIDVIKIHQMHVLKGTKLEEAFLRGDFNPMTAEEYVRLVTVFLRNLSPDIIVDRLIGDRAHDLLISPKWSLKKGELLKMIEDELKNTNARQGVDYEKK